MLDLHGARIEEAEALAEAAVFEAARHGRSTVRLIHGASTAEGGTGRRTIKGALHALLDEGAFAPYITSSFRAEGHLLLGIASSASPLPGRLTLRDIQ